MDELLKSIWEKSKRPIVRAVGLFLVVLSTIFTIISLASDTGFQPEIQKYRSLVWLSSAGIALTLTIIWLYRYLYKTLTDNRNLVNQLQDKVNGLENEKSRLEQERESAFGLMKSYKARTQEDIINELQRIALFGIMQEQWRKKGAQIERLRVENASPAHSKDTFFCLERITVMINLGVNDKVQVGMRFIVQDPTDFREYGMVEIQEVTQNGATCRVAEITDRAFWNGALQKAQEGVASIVNAPANIIIPASPLKEISPENARQLLTWLQSIRKAELQ